MNYLDRYGLDFFKVAKVASDPDKMKPGGAFGYAMAGDVLSALALLFGGRATEADQPAIDSIENMLKEKGVNRHTRLFPGYIPPEKYLPKNSKKNLRLLRIKPNSVVGPNKMSLDSLAHEAGHATGRQDLLRFYSKGTYVPALLGMAIGIAQSNRGKTDEERLKALRQGQMIAGISAVPVSPVLAEEARASIRGAGMVLRRSGVKRLPKYLARMSLGFGSYAAIPAGSLYTIKKMQDRKKKILDRQKRLKRQV